MKQHWQWAWFVGLVAIIAFVLPTTTRARPGNGKGHGQHQGEIQCCLADEDETECEEATPEECSAAGGDNLGAGSCEPNPCPPPTLVRCCIAENEQGEDEDEGESEAPECEQLTASQCSEEGGTAIGPGSCEPNPCVTSPSGAFLD